MAFLYAVDIYTVYHLYDYHVVNHDAPGHKEFYRAITMDDLRIVMPPETKLLLIHVLTGILPLFLAVT